MLICITNSNSKLPAILELELKHLQGKGSGGVSVQVEAKVALGFLSRIGIENPVVFDIGANIGSYSDAILRVNPQAKIYAFEPSKFARKELEDRFSTAHQVTVVPLALSDSVSTKTLWSDYAGSPLASLTKRKLEHFKIDFEFSEQVQVSTLDSWRNLSLVTPDLIKMDVEGHELDVLNGGIETLALVSVVQFEFGGCNIDTRTFFQDFWYLFTQGGFSIYRISESGPILLPNYSEEDEYFSTTNYLAVRD